ncbi:MAG: hypothetical protein INR64_10675 [Caulobacteraceae bacterium]|nr:hypothetical protein [Caulobacter sp.]
MEVWGRSPTPLGDPAFTADGRLVVSHHPAFRTDARVSVFTAADALAPYPGSAWNDGGGADAFDSPQGLRTDAQGVMWIADLGSRGDVVPRIVAWDTRNDRLHRVIELPRPATHDHSEPQDLMVDLQRGRLYIADEGAGRGGDGSRAALIVVDLASGDAWRVLEREPCIRPADVDIVVDRRVLQVFDEAKGTSRPVRVGVDGVAMDARGEWFYFGALNGGAVYRVRCDDLADRARSADLSSRVERYAERPNAGGMWMDGADDLYLVEIEARAVGVIASSDRRYRRVAHHPDMLWPDGLVGGPDGWIYVTASELPLSPQFNAGRMTAEPPHRVFRFRPPGAPA